jgi:hypothetical protein
MEKIAHNNVHFVPFWGLEFKGARESSFAFVESSGTKFTPIDQ